MPEQREKTIHDRLQHTLPADPTPPMSYLGLGIIHTRNETNARALETSQRSSPSNLKDGDARCKRGMLHGKEERNAKGDR